MNKIFIDTNILISAIVFDKKELELLIQCTSEGDNQRGHTGSWIKRYLSSKSGRKKLKQDWKIF